ncbi:MAG: FHA domain-containing protein [Acidobacteria bacterium]|nr:MAG: FHA domain-containing protein [Acidobacteriota bacterium]
MYSSPRLAGNTSGEPLKGASMAKLKIISAGTGEHSTFPLTQSMVRIGRHPDNDIIIGDHRISRLHVLIERKGEAFRIKDPKSPNGTMLNGTELVRDQWYPLRPGDKIVLAKGAATLEFVDESQPPEVSFSDTPVAEEATVFRSADQIIGDIRPSDATRLLAAGPQEMLRELARMQRHVDKLSERLTLISKLSQALGSVSRFSLDDIYQRSIELLFKFTPADRCTIMRMDRDTDQLQPVCTRYRPGREEIQSLPISRTITDRVRREQQSLLWTHSTADSQAPGTLVKHGIHSVMCAPLIGLHALVGVLYVDRQSPTEFFDVDDLELLNTVAGPTAMAIDNALAFEQLRREEMTRAAYNRFLPPHLVDKLVASPEAIQLGGANKVVTILFSDIREFTTLAEKTDPRNVVELLNDYFTEMTEIVFANNGTLDKFIGDGLMVLFGAPESTPQDAINAVRAAIEMQQHMVVLGQQLRRYGFPLIRIGIGINTGEVTVGYIGSERRTDYTAIGDAVNLAARLEGRAAPGQILISESTVAQIGDAFPVRRLGPAQVKGKTEPIEVFEVLWTKA